MKHKPLEMIFHGRDYVTERINGKRCHHKAIYTCRECSAEKRYFLNLMPKGKVPFCNGEIQTLI